MLKNEMNEYDYQLLTNTWDGPYGAAYSTTFEFCREFGWIEVRDGKGELTEKGKQAIDEYEKKRVDVI